MNIYFAVSDDMIEKQGMPERSEKANTFHWTLSYGNSKYGETFLAASLATSAGDILDSMKEYKIKKPYSICRAEIKESNLVKGLRAALVGDVMWEVKIAVTEITRIK